jgi:hypothetical protein
MPLLDVCLEVEAQEQAAAKANENSHPCDLCHQQVGTSFLDHQWLCLKCRWLRELQLEAERGL